MRPNSYSQRNEAREERKRELSAAGLMSDRFPGVASVVVTMNYNRGSHSAVLRTLNFYPGSPAFFKISAPGAGFDAGGIDLTQLIQGMISRQKRSAQGEYSPREKDSAVIHPSVDYKVAITYS